jgi:hypothetical protein
VRACKEAAAATEEEEEEEPLLPSSIAWYHKWCWTDGTRPSAARVAFSPPLRSLDHCKRSMPWTSTEASSQASLLARQREENASIVLVSEISA